MEDTDRNKKLKYLCHLSDMTAYTTIEIDMEKLVKDEVISQEVYNDNFK